MGSRIEHSRFFVIGIPKIISKNQTIAIQTFIYYYEMCRDKLQNPIVLPVQFKRYNFKPLECIIFLLLFSPQNIILLT